MYDSIQFLCKSIVISGIMCIVLKTYDHISYVRPVFMIDGFSGVDTGYMQKEREFCKKSEECATMALAVYHEARGEGWDGMKAVANVIKNRVESSKFKNTVVDVVHRPWQFSYVHELDNKEPRDLRSYRKALIISHRVLTGKVEDNTMGSTHYLAPKKLKKLPRWANEFERTVAINNHVFFRG